MHGYLAGMTYDSFRTVKSIYIHNSVITSTKRPNKLCSYKRVSLLARCMVEVKEKYFKKALVSIRSA